MQERWAAFHTFHLALIPSPYAAAGARLRGRIWEIVPIKRHPFFSRKNEMPYFISNKGPVRDKRFHANYANLINAVPCGGPADGDRRAKELDRRCTARSAHDAAARNEPGRSVADAAERTGRVLEAGGLGRTLAPLLCGTAASEMCAGRRSRRAAMACATALTLAESASVVSAHRTRRAPLEVDEDDVFSQDGVFAALTGMTVQSSSGARTPCISSFQASSCRREERLRCVVLQLALIEQGG